MIELRAGAATDVGLVRSNNQDELLLASPLFAVADGMGGPAAGEVAAATAISRLGHAFAAAGEPTADSLLDAARTANRAVWDQAEANPEMRGMGTTLVALALVRDGRIAVINIGDSRLYVLHDGELRQVTSDHNLVAELVAEGRLSKEEAEFHPRRNVITRALGVDPEVPVDLFLLDPVAGDRFVLCSDGLFRELNDDHIASLLHRLADPEEAARELVAEAKFRGGNDNITVIVVDVVDPAAGDQAEPVPETPASAKPAGHTDGPADRTDGPAGRTDGPSGHSDGPADRTDGPAGHSDGPADPTGALRSRPEAPRRRRVLSFRVVAFVVGLLALLGLAAAGIAWYARSSYFIGLNGNRIVIYQGRPGGVLWFRPTVAEVTKVTTADVESRHAPTLAAGVQEPTLAAAIQYVKSMVVEKQDAAAADGVAPTQPHSVDRAHPGYIADIAILHPVDHVIAIRSAPARRRTELGLIVLAVLLIGGLYALAGLGKAGNLPADLGPFLGAIFALLLVAHLAMRWLAPNADPILLPTAGLLNGIGYVFIARLSTHEARLQAVWTAAGIAAFVATLAVVRRVRDLERYRYSLALGGIALLLLPLVPGIGEDINGARLWIHVGSFNFQPGEIAKLALAVFFASVMVERADVLSQATRRVGRFLVLDPRYLAPILAAWGISLLIFLAENDLGSSFLFFALFIGMLWVATGRTYYLGLGAALFAFGSYLALKVIGHAKTRVQGWLDPWSHASTTGYQLIQGWFAIAAGGMFGEGPGQSNASHLPEASTDLIFAVIADELGLFGATALLIGYLLMVGSGLRIAIRCDRGFEKLLATGLSLILGVQTFVIVGGVTRLIPLTGVTLPFVSYGGSSLIANYILVALLLRISHDTETPALPQDAADVTVGVPA